VPAVATRHVSSVIITRAAARFLSRWFTARLFYPELSFEWKAMQLIENNRPRIRLPGTWGNKNIFGRSSLLRAAPPLFPRYFTSGLFVSSRLL
jgi:hypothetical protein